ncbi:hypothetical protein IEE94_00810 [Yimella sp. cx-573]|nr:hypothetical protein [Yimella sp. cx-573]
MLNYGRGWTVASTVAVPVGADGKIKLYAGWSSIDLAADVVGWYASSPSPATPGALYMADDPERWYDGCDDLPFEPGDYIDIPIDFKEDGGSVLRAVKFNLTALNGAGNGWFTAWDGVGAAPKTSVLNFAKGEISPNLTTIPVRRIGTRDEEGW